MVTFENYNPGSMSLKINFYCNQKYQDRVLEPIESSKSFPKWFSELPLQKKNKYTARNGNIYDIELDSSIANIKKCLGVTEFLNTGYIIPAWADFVFREQEDGNLFVNWVENYFDETSYVAHTENEYFTMPNKPIYGHFGKIFTPWMIKTDPGVSCLITHPVWHNNKLFTTSTAIFHTDKSPVAVPWFFEWNYKIRTQMSLENIDLENQVVPKGEPIALIIPFYRKKFTSKINYIPEEDFKSMMSVQGNLTHESISGEKCPYVKFRKSLGKMFKTEGD